MDDQNSGQLFFVSITLIHESLQLQSGFFTQPKSDHFSYCWFVYEMGYIIMYMDIVI